MKLDFSLCKGYLISGSLLFQGCSSLGFLTECTECLAVPLFPTASHFQFLISLKSEAAENSG